MHRVIFVAALLSLGCGDSGTNTAGFVGTYTGTTEQTVVIAGTPRQQTNAENLTVSVGSSGALVVNRGDCIFTANPTNDTSANVPTGQQCMGMSSGISATLTLTSGGLTVSGSTMRLTLGWAATFTTASGSAAGTVIEVINVTRR